VVTYRLVGECGPGDPGLAVITASAGCQVGPGPFKLFLNFQILPNLKFQMMALLLSKICQTLQGDSLEHKEQLSFLDRLKIPLDFEL
jgi:hypothetical protein